MGYVYTVRVRAVCIYILRGRSPRKYIQHEGGMVQLTYTRVNCRGLDNTAPEQSDAPNCLMLMHYTLVLCALHDPLYFCNANSLIFYTLSTQFVMDWQCCFNAIILYVHMCHCTCHFVMLIVLMCVFAHVCPSPQC